jgi:hypothetical protein
MTYQVIGFVAFPLVNIPLGIILWILPQTISSSLWLGLVLALPWLVNGIIIVLAFLLHPEFAIGYIAFVGVVVALVIALSVVFVAACFVIIPLAPVIGDLANWVFIFLIAAGLLGLVVLAIYLFTNWWSSYKNNSQ